MAHANAAPARITHQRNLAQPVHRAILGKFPPIAKPTFAVSPAQSAGGHAKISVTSSGPGAITDPIARQVPSQQSS